MTRTLLLIPLLTFSSLAQAAPSGAELYEENCQLCHKADGSGNATSNYPPLAQSEWLSGSKENLIRIMMRGLEGTILVNGEAYDGFMPTQSHLKDEEVAAVLNYIRTTWGEPNLETITMEEVKAFRGQSSLPALKASELTLPPSLRPPSNPIASQKLKKKKANGATIGLVLILLAIALTVGISVALNKKKSC